ncbi:MAG: hypothetical protein EPN92_11775 [Chitinophagaceae bacterium]|nr:MAG: hypothetical protein EPN92_11775 [Chitinophagaceae bacterium]
MPETLTISTNKPKEKAFDYESLRSTAIQHIEDTASKIWTDYNVHDPGITSMELLCYAITDLGYRTSYPVPDLLTDEKSDPQTVIKHFFTAKQILPTRPATINDYRKLLVDIVGIKNAWLRKRTKKVFADLVENKLVLQQPAGRRNDEVKVKGWYDVLLEYDVTVKKDEVKKALLQKAKGLVLDNRNLCEDFLEVKEVDRQPFRLCSEIEIKSTANAFDTLAAIFLNIQLFLNPLIKFYTLQEMLDAKIPADRIFNGPTPEKGFIKSEELTGSELKAEIRLSDIMNEILKVDGAININEIIFNPTDQAEELENKWVVKVKDGFQPVVDVLASNVLVYKDGMPFRPDMAEVKLRYEKLLASVLDANETKSSEDILFSTGKFRHPSVYLPLRYHYPKTYGIGHWGLPNDATALRKVQAKQLKGYLWLFDQLLANYLSQLASLRHLFSLDETETQTYFTQLADEFKNAKDLFAAEPTITDHLHNAAEPPALFHKRRNLFLDHLLSRFAESFYDHVSILQSIFPATDPKEIIKVKLDFLKIYPALSSERFLGYRYHDAAHLWDTDNISGLEKRLHRLLAFQNGNRRTLVNLITGEAEEIVAGNKKFRFHFKDNHTGKLLLLSTDLFDTVATCDEELEVAFLLATDITNYKVVNDGSGKFQYELHDKIDKLIASGEKFNTKKAAEAALKDFLEMFKAQSEEGMFLIEHLLLFPDNGEIFMPICVDPDCDDCSDNDPYSFRISIVLPAYAPRFLNMDFRRYCERTIRMETPAHILPKICWVSNDQLHELEDIYKEWLMVKAGAKDDTDGKILKQLIIVLTSLKSIYPPSTLQDCTSREERKLFLLNQNSLGTLKS